MTDDAKRRIEHGAKYPYDGERPEQDWAHRAARGIAADLCDRRGIKWEMGKVDDDSESDYSVRCDIVDSHAAIIRAALVEPTALQVADYIESAKLGLPNARYVADEIRAWVAALEQPR